MPVYTTLKKLRTEFEKIGYSFDNYTLKHFFFWKFQDRERPIFEKERNMGDRTINITFVLNDSLNMVNKETANQIEQYRNRIYGKRQTNNNPNQYQLRQNPYQPRVPMGNMQAASDELLRNDDVYYPTNENKQIKTTYNDMKKNIKRITESDIERMVTESVNKLIFEGRSYDEVSQALQILQGVANSSYIPFSSPSPSSTESNVKEHILNAIEELKMAQYEMQNLHHDRF